MTRLITYPSEIGHKLGLASCTVESEVMTNVGWAFKIISPLGYQFRVYLMAVCTLGLGFKDLQLSFFLPPFSTFVSSQWYMLLNVDVVLAFPRT
jgi:hypothetical protein